MSYAVTLIPGDGIGPELAEAATAVLEATGIAFAWDRQEAGFPRFRRISRFVGTVLNAPPAATPLPIALTCGAPEENLANNRAVAAALRRQGHAASLHVNRDGQLSAVATPVKLAAGPVDLAVEFSHDTYQFSFRQGSDAWQPIGPALDAAMLSDEFATRFLNGFANSFGFTGNFIGIACQDLAGTRKSADFDYLSYEEA